MIEIQALLDKEATLGNRRILIHKQIKAMRGKVPRACWGTDDCSTIVLMHCPWRMDCDSLEAQTWQDSNSS